MQLAAYHYLVGPVCALLVVGTLMAVSRWGFGSMRRRRPPAADDFGLLVPVATFPSREAAERARRLLGGDGIRATVAAVHAREPVRVDARGWAVEPDRSAHHRLLVFPDDAGRARALLDR